MNDLKYGEIYDNLRMMLRVILRIIYLDTSRTPPGFASNVSPGFII